MAGDLFTGQPAQYTRILGIDPGAAHVGWAIVDVAPTDALWVDGGCIEPDSLNWAWLNSLIRLNYIVITAIEKPTIARAAANVPILATMLMAGRIAGMLEYAQRAHRLITSHEWRAALTGDRQARNAVIEHHLRDVLGDSMPKRSNPHSRDAAGLAWFAGKGAGK